MEEEKGQEDQSQKTQEPTPHRKEKAKQKGQIPHSREINHFFMISALLAVIWFGGEPLSSAMTRLLKNWMASMGDQPTDSRQLLENCREVISSALVMLSGVFLTFVIFALAANGLQGRFRALQSNIQPQLSRISLLKGFKKMFSMQGIVEFFKGLFKLSVIFVGVYVILRPEFEHVDALSGIQLVGTTYQTQVISCKLLFSIVLVVIALAVADYTYQWFKTLKDLRMSHTDIREEQKHLEGDPLVKQKQRQKRSDLAQATHITQTVPEATVVITNPLHYAVALKWNMGMNAPVVVAKGSDFLALRIREIAKEHLVPLIENPPLARVLYKNVDLNQEIQPEHYKAVAEIIRYVLNIK